MMTIDKIALRISKTAKERFGKKYEFIIRSKRGLY